MRKRKTISPPTGDGIRCDCIGVKNPQGKPVPHHHGEFMHLLPRFRHNGMVSSGLGNLKSRANG